MFPYEGPSDALRLRMRPPVHKLERMEDLPMKPEGQTIRELEAEYQREYRQAQSAKAKTSIPKEPWEKRKATADQKVKQASAQRKPKPLPPLQGGYKESLHPRDRFGRFAVKAIKATGHAVGRTVKATGKAIKGTAKAVKSAHRTVKRVQSSARKRAALEHRERRLDLHKREQAAGLKRKKVVRRKR